MSVTTLLSYIPHILIVSGIFSLSWLFGRMSRSLGSLVSFIGLFIGMVALATAALSFLKNASGIVTFVLLLAVGLSLLLKPLKNLRWAALVALASGIIALYYANAYFGQLGTAVMLVIFIVVALPVYLMFKFAEDILHSVGSLLSWPPVAVAVGLLCLAQGTLLLLGGDLLQFVSQYIKL